MASYSSYLRTMGLAKGEFNAFVMTKSEWQNSQKTVEQKHQELEQDLVNCQNAWYSSMQAGLVEDANHAKINERKAYDRLVAFEKENGL